MFSNPPPLPNMVIKEWQMFMIADKPVPMFGMGTKYKWSAW